MFVNTEKRQPRIHQDLKASKLRHEPAALALARFCELRLIAPGNNCLRRKCNVENCVWVEFAPLSFGNMWELRNFTFLHWQDFWKTCKLDNILFLWPSMNFVQANARIGLTHAAQRSRCLPCELWFCRMAWNNIHLLCLWLPLEHGFEQSSKEDWNCQILVLKISGSRSSVVRICVDFSPYDSAASQSRSRPAKGCDPKRSKAHHSEVRSHTTGKRIRSCWRNQLEATGTTRCWSCW